MTVSLDLRGVGRGHKVRKFFVQRLVLRCHVLHKVNCIRPLGGRHRELKMNLTHPNTLDAECKIPTARVVTSQQLMPRLSHLATWAETFHNMYAHKGFRQAKLDVYMAKQRVHWVLEDTLKKGTLMDHGVVTKRRKHRHAKNKMKNNPTPLRRVRVGLGDGDWNRGLRPKGHAPVPSRHGLWQKMSERNPLEIKMINEWRTSKRCSQNHSPVGEMLTKVPEALQTLPADLRASFERQWHRKTLNHMEAEVDQKRAEESKEEMFRAYQTRMFRHRLLYCQSCKRILNRDVNAAKNILSLTMMWPLHRPDLDRSSSCSGASRVDS